jgi:hypothetical protein
VAEGHAAVVEEVDELDRKDRAEEGRMGQRGRAKGLGEAAEVGAEETEPLWKAFGLAAVLHTHAHAHTRWVMEIVRMMNLHRPGGPAG